MAYLFDSNILLRLVYREHIEHVLVRTAVAKLLKRGEDCYFTAQNLAEFWSASTRPATARGGLGRSTFATDHAARVVERLVKFLPDDPAVHIEWRKLVVAYGVQGVEVYDARLVAMMKVHRLTHILTTDKRDFNRYSEITPVHPEIV